MPDSMSSSPLVVALDPRVDEQVVQDQMQTAVEPQEGAEAEGEPQTESQATASTEESADKSV
jgi:hypothetical protein